MPLDRTIEYVLPTLPGWCSVAKGLKMAETVVSEKPNLCVELGVFGGRSLVAIAFALKVIDTGKVFGIDPYSPTASLEGTNDVENSDWWRRLDHEQVYVAAAKALDDLELTRFAEILRARSQDAAARFSGIDLLHQDSNHSEEVSCLEIDLYAPKMKHGGIWIMDDTDWPSMRAARKKIRSLGFEVIHQDPGWEILRAPK